MPELNCTLTIGSTGEDVGDIQFRLRVLKQDIPDEEINGSYYGPETQKAVRAFQAGAGLTPDRPGEVDRVTAERIDELFAKVSDEVKATFLQFELTPTDIGTLAAMLGGSLEAQATTLAGIDANLDAQLTKVEAQTNVLTELANTLSDPPPLAINVVNSG